MELITIRNFDNYFSAHIILGRLQSEGITCYLRDENANTIYPVLTNAIGGIKLDVPIEYAQRAIDLLKKFEAEYLLSAVCPACKTNEVEIVEREVPANFLMTWLKKYFSDEQPEVEHIYHCRQCGYEAKTLPDNYLYGNPAVEN